VVHGVVREHDVEGPICEGEPFIRVQDPEGASVGPSLVRCRHGVRIDVDPGHLGAEILGEERRDSARAAGNVEHRRHARSEPGRELVGLRGLHPTCLAEILVVRLAPNSCLDVGADGGARHLVEIGILCHGPDSILEGRITHRIESVTR
jgi:hypothetical protein